MFGIFGKCHCDSPRRVDFTLADLKEIDKKCDAILMQLPNIEDHLLTQLSQDVTALADESDKLKLAIAAIEERDKNEGCVNEGTLCHVEGKNNRVQGELNHAEGEENFVSGSWNSVSGCANSIEEGVGCSVSGSGNAAYGYCCVVGGSNNRAQNLGELAAGYFNDSHKANGENTLFSVGNGAGEQNRRNAFEVTDGGDIYIWFNGQYVKLQSLLNAVVNENQRSGITAPTEEQIEAAKPQYKPSGSYPYGMIGSF